MKLSFILLLSLLYFPVSAQVNYNEVDIKLYTFGAGQNYWEAFGHSALRVKINDIDYMYGFGYFDFNDEDFFIKFAKGQMHYFLGIQEAPLEIDSYISQGRSVWSQNLSLSAPQKKKLINKLNSLAQVKNRYYQYDYFLNNCTSKIRDLLDETTDGEISKQLKGIQARHSWSDLTFPVMNQSWMNLGIAIAYGVPAYQLQDKWSLSVFPENFAHDLEQIKTHSSWNGVLEQHNQAKNQLVEYSFVKTHYAISVILSVIFLGLVVPLLSKLTIYLWLTLQSIIGCGIVFLWFFSEHSVAMWNINILLFSPFALLLTKNSFAHMKRVFITSNILWVVLALFLTNIYLLGFCFINFIVLNKLRQLQE